MEVDGWQPQYRSENSDHGLAWDACISGGSCWVMDCGDIGSVRAIHTTEPNGRFVTEESKDNVRRLVESIMNQFQGRPHWGKIHFQTAEMLSKKYPEWDVFQELRSGLDPFGRFTNNELDRVLGKIET